MASSTDLESAARTYNMNITNAVHERQKLELENPPNIYHKYKKNRFIIKNRDQAQGEYKNEQSVNGSITKIIRDSRICQNEQYPSSQNDNKQLKHHQKDKSLNL